MFAPFSTGWESPRKEILHNIDPLWPAPESDGVPYMKTSKFNIDVRAAVRVGDWKLITGDPSRGDPSEHKP